MQIKADPTIRVDELNSAVLVALAAANDVWKSLGVPHGATITSGNEGHPGDGLHHEDSLHYPCNAPDETGRAVDLRTWEVNPEEAARRLRQALPYHFDVVNEGSHIHVEFDPDKE